MENTIDPQQLELFITQSNAIENVYGDKALKASLEAWDYLMALGSEPYTLVDILNTQEQLEYYNWFRTDTTIIE